MHNYLAPKTTLAGRGATNSSINVYMYCGLAQGVRCVQMLPGCLACVQHLHSSGKCARAGLVAVVAVHPQVGTDAIEAQVAPALDLQPTTEACTCAWSAACLQGCDSQSCTALHISTLARMLADARTYILNLLNASRSGRTHSCSPRSVPRHAAARLAPSYIGGAIGTYRAVALA
jgi:hypothetical protein